MSAGMITLVTFMAAMPQVTFQDPVSIVKDMKTYIDYQKDVIETAGKGFENLGLEDISRLVSGAGPALQGISVVLQGILVFLPEPESAELRAIKAGFNEMRDQFAAVRLMLKDISDEMPLPPAANRYRKAHDELHTMLEQLANIGIGRMEDNTTSGMQEFKESCEKKSPLELLNTMVTDANVNTTVLPTLINTAFDAIHYDMHRFNRWLTLIANNVLDAAINYHACLAVRNRTQEFQADAINSTEEKIEDALTNIAAAVNNLKADFHTQIQADGLDFLGKNHDHDTFSDELRDFLSKKYYWGPKWLVVSHPIPKYSWKEYSLCQPQATACVHIEGHRKSVFIAWCNLGRRNAFNDGPKEYQPAVKAMSYKQVKDVTLNWLKEHNFRNHPLFSRSGQCVLTAPVLLWLCLLWYYAPPKTVCEEQKIIGAYFNLVLPDLWGDAEKAAEFIKEKNWLVYEAARGILILEQAPTSPGHSISMEEDTDCFVRYDEFCRQGQGEIEVTLRVFFAL